MTIAWDKVKVRINSAGSMICDDGWQLDADWVKRFHDYDLWFVWSGRGEMRHGDEVTPLHPGVCFWVRPDRIYTATQDPENHLGVTFIHFDLLDDRGSALRDGPVPCVWQELTDVSYFDATLKRVVSLFALYRANSSMHHLSLATAATLLTGVLMDYDGHDRQVSRLVPAGTPLRHHHTVHEVASRMLHDPSNIPPIADMARQAGYSADHFARIFKQVLGRSPTSFAVDARLARARHLLAESSLSIKQIADALNYQDTFYFSHQFRRRMGMSPSAYRKRGAR